MKNGPYTLVVVPEEYPGKRYRGRYAYEHVVNFWKKEGRMPLSGCVVHHRDENKRNNAPGNLEEKTGGEHAAEHNRQRPIQHGALAGYQRGCRCESCRAANASSMARYRASRRSTD
jgi:hypothetical protein